jgi:hypothetical protein
MTRGERQHAAEFERYMGADIGIRRSLAEIARELPTLSRRTPLTGALVRHMMARLAAAGLGSRRRRAGGEAKAGRSRASAPRSSQRSGAASAPIARPMR